MKLIDVTGQRFGRLVVIGRTSDWKWICRCDCGARVVSGGWPLRNGRTKSCGCHRIDQTTTKRGLSHKAEYDVWRKARNRCEDPRAKAFPLYGGRGIAMCQRWQDDFLNFYDDMGPRPSLKHSLDRINNDGPYSPDNCRWATRSEQARNRRNNHNITAFGKTMTSAEWGAMNGIDFRQILQRLKRGWTPERAVIR